MKKSTETYRNPRAAGIASALLLATLLPQASNAQNASFQFESASDLTSFNQVGSTDVASTTLGYSSTAGTGGSGGLTFGAATDTTAIYSGASYNLSVSTVTIAVNFLVGTVPTGSANAVAMLGLVGSNNKGFYSNTADNFLGGRVRHVSSTGANGLQSQTKISGTTSVTASPADASVANIGLTANNWYHLELSLSRSETLNTFNYTLSLSDIGSDGTAIPASLANGSISGTMANADLYNNTALYAAFRGVPTAANPGWVAAFDDFTVTATAVPEPSAMTLGSLAGGFMLLFSRRQKR
jgi:hypothetical protein